jgi:hypothetical protein
VLRQKLHYAAADGPQSYHSEHDACHKLNPFEIRRPIIPDPPAFGP